MVSLLHRYVFRELVKSFAVSFAVLVTVMILGTVFQPLRRGLGLGSLMRFLPYSLPYLLTWVVPAAMLSACVMAYGRLSADNELLATRVSGIPLRYMCYPALAMAAALALAMLPLNTRLVPWCRVAKRQVLRQIFMEQPFRISMIGGHETIELGDHKIYVESMTGDVLHNVVVIAPRRARDSRAGKAAAKKGDDRNTFAEQHPEVSVYRAREARYRPNPDKSTVRIMLQDAEYTIVTPERNARSWLNLRADEQELEIPVENPLDVVHQLRRGELTSSGLAERAAELRARLANHPPARELRDLRRRLAESLAEIYQRQVLSAAVFCLALVGVPLGIWIRREGRLASFTVAVLVFLLLYALIVGGEGMAEKERLPAALALWTPTALIAGLGVGLLVHLSRH